MKTEVLEKMLSQFGNCTTPFVRISRGTASRLGKGIEASKHDGDLFEVKGIEYDAKTGDPVLLLEVRK